MQFTKTCLVCQQDKVDKAKLAGLLEPLPVPSRPWESVSLDFITHLPKVGEFEAILVIVPELVEVPLVGSSMGLASEPQR